MCLGQAHMSVQRVLVLAAIGGERALDGAAGLLQAGYEMPR